MYDYEDILDSMIDDCDDEIGELTDRIKQDKRKIVFLKKKIEALNESKNIFIGNRRKI